MWCRRRDLDSPRTRSGESHTGNKPSGHDADHDPDDPADAHLFRRRWLRTAQVLVDLEKLLSGHLAPGVAETDRVQSLVPGRCATLASPPPRRHSNATPKANRARKP